MPKNYGKIFPDNPFKTEIYSRMGAMKLNLKKFAKMSHIPVSDVQRMLDGKNPSPELIASASRILGGDVSMWEALKPKDPAASSGTNMFYDEVRNAFKEKRFSVATLSEKTGVSKGTVYNMLRFKNSYPTEELVNAIAELCYDESMGYAYWELLVEKVGGRKPIASSPKKTTEPEQVVQSETVDDTLMNESHENEKKGLIYFLMSDGSVISSESGKYILGIDPSGGLKVLLTMNEEGSYTNRGTFTKQGYSKVALGIYDGKFLVRIKNHKSLYAVNRYTSTGFVEIESYNENITVCVDDIENFYDSETLREVKL